jgi:type I restriction enzyme, S subunit
MRSTLSIGVVSALACVVPAAQILPAFNAVTCPLLEKVSANHRQDQTLATLRETLLPRLICGQIPRRRPRR